MAAENLTIMFVDMAGYAERTARQSRVQNKAMLRDFNGMLVPLIARFGGHRVKSIGDALLVTFRSPTDAVRCSMAMQDAVEGYNQVHTEGDPIRIRVALNVGEVRLEKHDIFGEAVNIAARVEELTPPGEIYMTGVVYLSMNKAEVPAEHIGEHMLKGISEPVRLFRVPPHRVARLKALGESLQGAPGHLPYGGMHLLPPDSHFLARVADVYYRAPYVDWPGKLRSITMRQLMVSLAGVAFVSAVAAEAYWLATRPPPLATPAETLLPTPTPPSVSEAAREALAQAHDLYAARKRVEAAQAYLKVLEMEPLLRHDSGLAANLVGTLGYAGDVAAQAIRTYPSSEFVYELSRRTGQPGRRGAQRAATLLEELGQAGRADQLALALTDLAEAPSCAERLDAVRRLRVMQAPRALPALREAVQKRGFSAFMRRSDGNQCLREEAQKVIVELEKTAASSS